MKKAAVFGKPGGGKSTLSKKISETTGITLYSLDLMQFKKNGERISSEEFASQHAELMKRDSWIIDGLGTLESFWERIEAADTLVYVDLPYKVHYWRVFKRFVKSGYEKPVGWPDGSSVLKGTLASWKYLRLSPRFWTQELFEEIQRRGKGKKIYRITSVRELTRFAL